MSTTAFSKYFQQELDVSQLLARMGGHSSPDDSATLSAIPSTWREWIQSDVVCSSCGALGAQIVSASRSKKSAAIARQAHFRFVNSEGGDGHHRFCEFYHADGTNKQPDALVNFAVARTHETKIVRQLVCMGIELNIFGQADIRAMRQWFFDFKMGSRFVVNCSPADIEWLWCLRGHYPNGVLFHPSHAQMPDYDWKRAARSQLALEHADSLAQIRDVPMTGTQRSRALLLAAKHQGEEMFDVSVLEPYYKKAVSLSVFIARNYRDLKFSDARIAKLGWDDFPSALFAFAALILWISEWDFDIAALKVANLIRALPPTNQTLGNVMGLNPFNDYIAWRMILLANKIVGHRTGQLEYQAELKKVLANLHAKHQAWLELQPSMNS